LPDVEAPPLQRRRPGCTKELVGARSPLRVHGDVRLFAESLLEPGAEVAPQLAAGEGGLLSIREGSVELASDGQELRPVFTLVVPPADEPGAVLFRAVEPSRIIRKNPWTRPRVRTHRSPRARANHQRLEQGEDEGFRLRERRSILRPRPGGRGRRRAKRRHR